MYVQNTHRETPLNLVQGKKQSEKVFQQAIARIQIPGRTRDQEQRVEGTLLVYIIIYMEH